MPEAEDRAKKETWVQPPPLLNMGVAIDPYWTQNFQELQRLLNKTPKETINWVVDNWFRATMKAHE
jgi:hypothetical protein